MPELPEVETTRRGIAPHLLHQVIRGAVVRQPQLRWPVPDLAGLLSGHTVQAIERRGKYILLRFAHGALIVHLGMSGSLRVLPAHSPARAHDHVDLLFGEHCLRLHDPRRFGAMLWAEGDPLTHPRLRKLGPEPLSDAFCGIHLQRAAAQRRVAIKQLIMDGSVVVGVGNIYASEALFHARIRPQALCRRISRARLDALADAIKVVLARAIERGGTTLRDFVNESGEPGYFAQELFVYGRAGEPCRCCATPIRTLQIGQRASAYCPGCQR